MGWTVTDAQAFAQTAHQGRSDGHGQPVMEHLEAVRERVEQMGGDVTDQVAAILHHVSEAGISPMQLELMGLQPRAVQIVDAMTLRPHETEDQQLRRVMDTPGAVRVLRADLAHQLHPDQLLCIDENERELTLGRCCHMLDVLNAEPELTFS